MSGHATGQKQAPSVACQGAGRVERRALSTPRQLVYNTHTGRILSKEKNDPIFWSVRDILDWFKRYIDDVLSLFRGKLDKAKWFINILNSICPGVVEFTFEFSEKKQYLPQHKVNSEQRRKANRCRLSCKAYKQAVILGL